MKCEQCRALIEDYFDGELNESAASQVRAHLGTCMSCASVAAAIGREQEIYATYEREIEVPVNLWSNIHARIQEDREVGSGSLLSRVRAWLARGNAGLRLSPAFAAALMVIAIVATATVMHYLHSRTQNERDSISAQATNPSPRGGDSNEAVVNPRPTQSSVPSPPSNSEPAVVQRSPKTTVAKRTPPPAPDPATLVREAEQKYVAAIGILSRDLKTRRRQLDPETRSRFDIALAEIDQSIDATRQAVRRNPNDPIAIGYMLTAYAKKVDFLRETARDEADAARSN